MRVEMIQTTGPLDQDLGHQDCTLQVAGGRPSAAQRLCCTLGPPPVLEEGIQKLFLLQSWHLLVLLTLGSARVLSQSCEAFAVLVRKAC